MTAAIVVKHLQPWCQLSPSVVTHDVCDFSKCLPDAMFEINIGALVCLNMVEMQYRLLKFLRQRWTRRDRVCVYFIVSGI